MNILFQICLFLVFISAAFAFFTYAFFWFENAGDTRRRHAVEASGKNLPSIMFMGIITGFISLLVVMATYPLGFIARLWRPKQISAGQPVIILTHGIYHNAAAWLMMRHRLRKAGFTNVFAMSYRSFFTSFDGVLKKFEKFIQRSRSVAPDQPFILVGHSLGGLLSRVYAENSSGDNVPAAVITLGAPHHGSKMAAFALGELGRSLRYAGPLFQKLDEEARGLPCQGFSLISPAESLVLPAESLKAPPGWIEFETPPVSHVGMLYSTQVARKVIELIKY